MPDQIHLIVQDAENFDHSLSLSHDPKQDQVSTMTSMASDVDQPQPRKDIVSQLYTNWIWTQFEFASSGIDHLAVSGGLKLAEIFCSPICNFKDVAFGTIRQRDLP